MREIDSGTRAVVEAAGGVTRHPVPFIEAEFRSVTLRIWGGMGTIAWNGQTWYGPGSAPVMPPRGITGSAIVEIGTAKETGRVEATALKVVVSGFPTALLSLAQDEMKTGGRCNVWMGFLNDAGTLSGEPLPWFAGWLDAASVEEEPGAARLTLTIESELRRLQIPVLRRLTSEDQHIDFPSDNFFKHVPDQPNWKGMWGQGKVGGGGGGAGQSPANNPAVRQAEAEF